MDVVSIKNDDYLNMETLKELTKKEPKLLDHKIGPTLKKQRQSKKDYITKGCFHMYCVIIYNHDKEMQSRLHLHQNSLNSGSFEM